MFLSDIEDGMAVFIDANIFVYHFMAGSGFNVPCTTFIERVEKGKIHGITSASVIQEATHRLMTEEAVVTFPNIKAKNITKYLKKHPDVIKKLTVHIKIPSKINLLNVEVIPIDIRTIEKSQTMKTLYGVLSNDALILQIMKDFALTKLASNDSDFEKVDFLTLYKPTYLPQGRKD